MYQDWGIFLFKIIILFYCVILALSIFNVIIDLNCIYCNIYSFDDDNLLQNFKHLTCHDYFVDS